MPKFNVCLTRDITESVVLEIEAETIEQAHDIAFAKDDAKPQLWETDDGDYDDNIQGRYVSWSEPVPE